MTPPLSALVSALLSGPAGAGLGGGMESGNDAPWLSRGPMPEPGTLDPIPEPAPIDPSGPAPMPPPTGRRSCASASHELSASHRNAAAARCAKAWRCEISGALPVPASRFPRAGTRRYPPPHWGQFCDEELCRSRVPFPSEGRWRPFDCPNMLRGRMPIGTLGSAVLSYAAMLAVLVAVLSAPAAAQDAPCRGYPESVRLLVTRGVEALRLVEREASDRIAGTRYPPI